MGNSMADYFLSFMVFNFKALFLKTLKCQLCRYFSLRPHDEFSWDKKLIIHNLCSYGSKSCNFEIIMYKYFMIKTLKIQKNGKSYCKKSFFGMKKIFKHQNLKIVTPRSITI